MIGYAENGKDYPVELDSSGKMYVNVPWTDTNTTYGVVGANGCRVGQERQYRDKRFRLYRLSYCRWYPLL